MEAWGARLGDYFLSPFPGWFGSRLGPFSPYKMPGPFVHFPVILAAVLLLPLFPSSGALAWTGRILLVVSAVYWGRDLAIFCHYLILLAPVVFFGVLLGMPPLLKMLPKPAGVEVQLGIVGGLVLGWTLRIWARLRD